MQPELSVSNTSPADTIHCAHLPIASHSVTQSFLSSFRRSHRQFASSGPVVVLLCDCLDLHCASEISHNLKNIVINITTLIFSPYLAHTPRAASFSQTSTSAGSLKFAHFYSNSLISFFFSLHFVSHRIFQRTIFLVLLFGPSGFTTETLDHYAIIAHRSPNPIDHLRNCPLPSFHLYSLICFHLDTTFEPSISTHLSAHLHHSPPITHPSNQQNLKKRARN